MIVLVVLVDLGNRCCCRRREQRCRRQTKRMTPCIQVRYVYWIAQILIRTGWVVSSNRWVEYLHLYESVIWSTVLLFFYFLFPLSLATTRHRLRPTTG